MTNYQIQITTRAQKDLKKLPTSIRKRIVQAAIQLEANRYPQQFKPLMGKEIAQFRLRVGDYRILYDVYEESKIVLILRIGHRRDIYK